MRAYLRTIVSALRQWLNSIRSRPIAGRIAGQPKDDPSREESYDFGEETHSDEAHVTEKNDEYQLSSAGNGAPDAMNGVDESREDPSVDDTPGSGTSIESDPVIVDRYEGGHQPANECSENQQHIKIPEGTGEAIARTNSDADIQSAGPIPCPAGSEKVSKGNNNSDSMIGIQRETGGKDLSAALGESDPAEQPDAMAVEAASSDMDINVPASRAGNAMPVMDVPMTEDSEQTVHLESSIATHDDEGGSNFTGDTISSEQAESDCDHLGDIRDNGDELNLDAKGTRPCPRCGITCLPDEIKQVFGYRTMRWTTANGESATVRRQSYCRRCRAEHATDRWDDSHSDPPQAIKDGGDSRHNTALRRENRFLELRRPIKGLSQLVHREPTSKCAFSFSVMDAPSRCWRNGYKDSLIRSPYSVNQVNKISSRYKMNGIKMWFLAISQIFFIPDSSGRKSKQIRNGRYLPVERCLCLHLVPHIGDSFPVHG